MIQKEIELSPEFKKQTSKAITSIVLFLLVYIILFIAAAALTVACIYAGVMLIISVPRFITIALGIGLASLGVLIFIFLIKFIFKSNKVDRSHLREITKQEEPEIFNLIDDIVNQVGTSFPKKVYLSTDVNASVFYDSSFWSMFLPIKKNLTIGAALVNTITKEELKAILSHEFGHFSQRTMKVGSYVHNVNQIIFNMLYDNDSFDKLAIGWANISGYFSIFVLLALKIIHGIQWILKEMYTVVNKSYMALSREMEFHADEIASHVTGYKPLKSSLLRMNLADHSFNSAISFYDSRIDKNLKSQNLYKEQSYLMSFFAEDDELPIQNGFPVVTVEELNKFNKSKLMIEDQWASHPSTEDRIARLEQNNIVIEEKEVIPANSIFSDFKKTQEELTNRIFKDVVYKETPTASSLDEFKMEFKKDLSKNSFSKVFNGYYDNKNPISFNIDDVDLSSNNLSVTDLFSDKNVNLNYIALALQNDIETIKQIEDKTIKIKTFDYDGKRYKRNESKALLTQLNTELEQINKDIKQNDLNIYRYFKQTENSNGSTSQLQELYSNFFEFDKTFDSKLEVYNNINNSMDFLQVTTEFDQIKSNFRTLRPKEKILKENIKELMTDDKFASEITTEMKDQFETYLEKDWQYFGTENYFDKNLETLFTSLNNYAYLLSRGYFLNKKELLDYKTTLTIN